MKEVAKVGVLLLFGVVSFTGIAHAVCIGSIAKGGDGVGYRYALAYIDSLQHAELGQKRAEMAVSDSLSATGSLTRDVAVLVAL